MVRTELVPTTGKEIEERGEKKPVGGTIGKEGEVKKKKRVGPYFGLRIFGDSLMIPSARLCHLLIVLV